MTDDAVTIPMGRRQSVAADHVMRCVVNDDDRSAVLQVVETVVNERSESEECDARDERRGDETPQ